MEAHVRRVLGQGLVAGMLAYAMVVLLFLLLTLISGRPLLLTAAELGSVLTGGPAAEGGRALPAPVLAYNGVHLLFMLALGMAGAWLFHEWSIHPQAWYAVLLALVAGAVAVTLASGIYVTRFAHAAGWPAVAAANMLAFGVMGVYFTLTNTLAAPDD